ncbi:MAG: hypothetical protein IT337_17620 [Thermomicrobiales bacterium]|nr:hypothetical protein [Thermomicrobiales bacterium]
MVTDRIDAHCERVVREMADRGGLVDGARFEIGPGLGYAESWFGVWYAGRVITNCGLRTKADAQRYVDGHNAALDALAEPIRATDTEDQG